VTREQEAIWVARFVNRRAGDRAVAVITVFFIAALVAAISGCGSAGTGTGTPPAA
jgi:hypothetical protein